MEEGKTQLAGYLHRMSMDFGWLIIFSRSKVEDWDKIGTRERHELEGKTIEVIYM
ncbi:MAG: hypothetical protein GY795_45595 [Desulfobacterales bacterium]|nr:hypothetical protein [Desulfobacterales bacterium]